MKKIINWEETREKIQVIKHLKQSKCVDDSFCNVFPPTGYGNPVMSNFKRRMEEIIPLWVIQLHKINIDLLNFTTVQMKATTWKARLTQNKRYLYYVILQGQQNPRA